MKKMFLILLMIVLASVLILGSCAKPAPVPTPAPTPTPVEPIKLRFSNSIPMVTVFNKDVFPAWIEEIEERTAAIGKPVEITMFGAAALGKSDVQYDLVVNGVADIAMSGMENWPGRFPVTEVMELPFLFPSATVAGLVAWDLFEKYPCFHDQFAETKLLWFGPTAPAYFSMCTKQIKTLEDLKGMKVIGKGTPTNEALELMGATPVMIIMPETYNALERGLVDGGVLESEGTFAFKWHEVTKYRTCLPQGFFVVRLATSMNWDAWNSLPPEVQKIFEELSGRYMCKFSGEIVDKVDAHLLDAIKSYDKKVGNPEIYNLPQDEFQRWRKVVTPVYDKWITDMEAKGLPGRAILEDVLSLVKKYSE